MNANERQAAVERLVAKGLEVTEAAVVALRDVLPTWRGALGEVA